MRCLAEDVLCIEAHRLRGRVRTRTHLVRNVRPDEVPGPPQGSIKIVMMLSGFPTDRTEGLGFGSVI